MFTIKATEAQKSFGEIMDRARSDEAVIVERYGKPRVVIVDYERYQRLIEAERALLRGRLQQSSAAVSARAVGLDDGEVDRLIEQVRDDVSAEHAVP